jgi:hypothetical protein
VGVVGTFRVPTIAHGIDEAVPPVVAHYEVWSPWTVGLFEDYLQSEDRAPDYMIRSAEFPAATNEITLARYYDEIDKGRWYRVLQRRTVPRRVRVTPIIDQPIEFGEEIRIPREFRHRLLVATVDLRLNWKGRLLATLYQPPSSYLIPNRKLGSQLRISPIISRYGVVLTKRRRRRKKINHRSHHPLLPEVESKVRTLELEAELAGYDATQLYEPDIQLRVYVVEFFDVPQPARQ